MAEQEKSIILNGLEEHLCTNDQPVSQVSSIGPVPSGQDAVPSSKEMQLESQVGEIRQLPSESGTLPANTEVRKSYNILVTGTTGSGKSTLITGISGKTANNDHHTELGHTDTTDVVPVICNFEKHIAITLWDTPGLFSGSTNCKRDLKQVAKKCTRRDCVIFCIECTNARLISGNYSPALLSIRALTEYFGTAFWTNAIFALTFADNLEYQRPAWKKLTIKEKQEKFAEEITEWKSFISKNLASYARIPQETVDTVSVIPVGHFTTPMLLNGKNWITTMQEEALKAADKAADMADKSNEKTQCCAVWCSLCGCLSRVQPDDDYKQL